MSLGNLSQNYSFRKCFLDRNQVPTQSLIKKTMSPALAAVYFKSMSPKLKVIAGLEPPMKGGGESWYIPPKDLLEGRVVMKPFKSKYMSKLTCYGVDEIGMRVVEEYRQQMKTRRKQIMDENDKNWKHNVDEVCRQHWQDCSITATEENTSHIQTAFHQFCDLYTGTLNKFQDLLFDAAIDRIKELREELFQQMQIKYESFLHQQATMLYDRNTDKLTEEKTRLKTEFIRTLQIDRMELGRKLHDINLEKHIAIEKLRHYLECQNLACRLYVTLKEREECAKEIELAKHEHSKEIKALTKDIESRDVNIRLAERRATQEREFKIIWKKKVCHVVKNFQMFVSYCLNMVPEHADFFINVEKLMLLQLDEALEKPSSESIFVMDWERIRTPVPKPHPFHLFCDKKYTTEVDPNLCPIHTSSASMLPAIIINKRCIYAACDNFEQFTDRIESYINGTLEDDAIFEDQHDYSDDVPVQYTISQQFQELKLESSLQRVLQLEMANMNEASWISKCPGCEIPYCFGCSGSNSPTSVHLVEDKDENHTSLASASMSSGNKISSRKSELEHEREPKWESYMRHIKPKTCDCSKKAKKHLLENLPAYMRKMAYYDAPELLDYEPCTVKSLKNLVSKARGKKAPPPPPDVLLSNTKDMSTQWSDLEFDNLCTCFSHDGIDKFMKKLTRGIKAYDTCSAAQNFRVVGSSLSSSYMTRESASFADERALSLKLLIDRSSDIKEIFKKTDCTFD